MDLTSSLLLLSLTLLLLPILGHFKWGLSRKRRRNYPPGPKFALPFVGHLLQLGTKPHETFKKWKDLYGPIFSYQMGNQNAVVVSDPKLAKEFFSKISASGRPHNPILEMLTGKNVGILSTEGTYWEEQRRFAIRSLKDLGVAKGGVVEDIILHEANNLVTFLKQRAGLPLQGKRLFNGPIFNSLWTVVSGERIELDSSGQTPAEGNYVKLANELLEAFNTVMSNGLSMAPWVRHIFPTFSGWTRLVKVKAAMDKAAHETVDQRSAPDNPESASNLIEKYLAHIESTTSPSSPFYQETGKHNLAATVDEFFIAGSETTATTLEYILLYLIQYPQVQTKIQNEVDQAVGKSRLPCLNDRPNLPYTEAVIMEVMRRSTLTPIGFPRRALEDMEFNGFVIPKDTVLLPDIYNIHRDAESWAPDPDDFRPDRFLNEDKTRVVKNEALMPFSIGRRACIGETYAKDSLFLNLSCLMQTFRVESVDGKIDIDDIIPGISLMPKPFRVVFHPRSN